MITSENAIIYAQLKFFYFMKMSCFVLEISSFFVLNHSFNVKSCDVMRLLVQVVEYVFIYNLSTANHLNLAN